MRPESDDIDQPLGQKRRRSSRWHRPRAGTILVGLCVLVVFAGSGAIALRDHAFRESPDIADAQPQVPVEDAAEQADSSRKSAQSGQPGPAIIDVDPDKRSTRNNAITIRDPAALAQNSRTAHLPDPALIEETEAGPLPVRGEDGRRPFDVYAGSWSGARGARIAIVVGGLGISQTGTQAAIAKLPSEITLAFAPQGNSLGRWMQTARQEGHEVILQLPLEPFDHPRNNPGPRTLLVGSSWKENIGNLHWVLARITNYTGVMNYMGARFTADREAMAPLMRELGDRGLLFLDDGTSARSLTDEIARETGAPFAISDTAIDVEAQRGAILEKLDELERIARAQGFAIGTGSALEVTVDTVNAWANEVRKRGIELVPVSAVAYDPEQD